jgi:hypothetical protein
MFLSVLQIVLPNDIFLQVFPQSAESFAFLLHIYYQSPSVTTYNIQTFLNREYKIKYPFTNTQLFLEKITLTRRSVERTRQYELSGILNQVTA